MFARGATYNLPLASLAGIDVVQDACLMVEHMAAMADIGASDS